MPSMSRSQVKSAVRADAHENPPTRGRPPKRKRGKQPAGPAGADVEAAAAAAAAAPAAGGDAPGTESGDGGGGGEAEPAGPKADPEGGRQRKKRVTPKVTADEVKAKWALQDWV